MATESIMKRPKRKYFSIPISDLKLNYKVFGNEPEKLTPDVVKAYKHAAQMVLDEGLASWQFRGFEQKHFLLFVRDKILNYLARRDLENISSRMPYKRVTTIVENKSY